MELLEWRAQRLSREQNNESKQTLYETEKAEKVNYVEDLSAFGIKQVTGDRG